MSKLKIGLTLYSIQDDVEKDMDASLKAVKEMGYDYIELGGFYGRSPEEIAELLKKHDLQIVTIHMQYDEVLENTEETLKTLKTLGVKNFVIPWMGIENHKGHEGFEQAMKDIRKAAAILKENGIQMMYHNHEFEFEKYEDKYVLDWLYETLTTDVIKPQVDVCWAKYGGADPCEYLRKYAGQMKVVHFKDFVCEEMNNGPVYDLLGVEKDEGEDDGRKGFHFRPLGQGVQDFPSIIKAAEDAGIEYAIVEQDKAETATPMESVKMSLEYLRTLGV